MRGFQHQRLAVQAVLFVSYFVLTLNSFGEDTNTKDVDQIIINGMIDEVKGAVAPLATIRRKSVVQVEYIPGNANFQKVDLSGNNNNNNNKGSAPDPLAALNARLNRGSNKSNSTFTLDTSTPPTYKEVKKDVLDYAEIAKTVTQFQGVIGADTKDPVAVYKKALVLDGESTPATGFAQVVESRFPNLKDDFKKAKESVTVESASSHPVAPDGTTESSSNKIFPDGKTRNFLVEATKLTAQKLVQTGKIEDEALSLKNNEVKDRVLAETRALSEKQLRESNELRQREVAAAKLAAQQDQQNRNANANNGANASNGGGGSGSGGGGSAGGASEGATMPEFKTPPAPDFSAFTSTDSGRGIESSPSNDRKPASASVPLDIQPNPVNMSNGLGLNNNAAGAVPKPLGEVSKGELSKNFLSRLMLGNGKSTPGSVSSPTFAFNPPSGGGADASPSPTKGNNGGAMGGAAGDPYAGLGVERPEKKMSFNLVKDGGYSSGGGGGEDSGAGGSLGLTGEDGDGEGSGGGSTGRSGSSSNEYLAAVPVEPNGPKGLMGYIGLLHNVCKGPSGKSVGVCGKSDVPGNAGALVAKFPEAGRGPASLISRGNQPL